MPRAGADSDADPVDADEAQALFRPLAGDPAVLLAVSGGPDSLALMLLAARWADTPGRPTIHVATVDHGLREAARDEARQVGAWAAALGLPHAILAWSGTKPATGVQDAARQARYALLEAHAVGLGVPVVVTAHHADDQAETVLMRLARGSGPAGLAGMRARRQLGRVRLERPFLDLPKARLVATLSHAGHPWIDDPSNTDPRYGRTAARDALPVLAGLGITPCRLARLARRQARAEEAIEAAVDAAAALHLSERGEGAARLSAAVLEGPGEIALRLIEKAIRATRGDAADGHGPSLERLERLLARLSAAHGAGKPLKASAGGCVLQLRLAEVTIMREKERRRGRLVRSRPAKDAPLRSRT